MSRQCPICGDWIYDWENRPHVCKPKHLLLHDYYGDDWDDAFEVYAFDHEEAAEKWADETQCDWDYCLLDGAHIDVQVKSVSDGEVKTLRLTGESVPTYSAEEIAATKEALS